MTPAPRPAPVLPLARGSRERDVQAAIMELLARMGVWAVRVNTGKVRGPSGSWIQLAPEGTPDILACVRGRFLAIECKREGGKLRPAQLETLTRLERDGAIAFAAANLEEAERVVGAVLRSVDARRRT